VHEVASTPSPNTQAPESSVVNLSPWWPALRASVAVGVATQLVVGVALLAYVATRPAEYQARFSLLATPDSSARATRIDFGTLTALTLPGMPELARSPNVLDRVIARVDGAPSAGQLAGQISVELVPASGFARITVEDSDAERVAQLATALSSEIRALDLLAPVGTFRPFDASAPTTVQTSPDLTLGTGFALAAGALAGLLAAGLTTLLRPRIMGRRQAAALLDDPGIPILSLDAGKGPDEQLALLLARGGVTVVPSGDDAARVAEQAGIELEATGSGVNGHSPVDPGTRVIMMAAIGRTTQAELTNMYAGLRASDAHVVALLLV